MKSVLYILSKGEDESEKISYRDIVQGEESKQNDNNVSFILLEHSTGFESFSEKQTFTLSDNDQGHLNSIFTKISYRDLLHSVFLSDTVIVI